MCKLKTLGMNKMAITHLDANSFIFFFFEQQNVLIFRNRIKGLKLLRINAYCGCRRTQCAAVVESWVFFNLRSQLDSTVVTYMAALAAVH